MYVPKHFEAADVAWCHDLMRREPFAILVGTDEAGVPFATHLPVLLDETPAPLGRLVGHVLLGPFWEGAGLLAGAAICAGALYSNISRSWGAEAA